MAFEASLLKSNLLSAYRGLFLELQNLEDRIPFREMAEDWIFSGFAGAVDIIDASWLRGGWRSLGRAVAAGRVSLRRPTDTAAPALHASTRAILIITDLEALATNDRDPSATELARLDYYVSQWSETAAASSDRLLILSGNDSVNWNSGAWPTSRYSWARAEVFQARAICVPRQRDG